MVKHDNKHDITAGLLILFVVIVFTAVWALFLVLTP
jgi:hypothetical protein